MKHLYIVFILFACFSCTNKKREYYENGNLKKEYSVVDDSIKEGNYIEYYENGSIKAKGSFINNSPEACFVYYHLNGNVEGELYYKNSRPVGLSFSYYPNGNIKNVREWVLLKDKSIPNGDIMYDSSGLKTFSYKLITNEIDTVKDNCKIRFEVISKGFNVNNMEVYYGGFNKYFELEASKKIDTIYNIKDNRTVLEYDFCKKDTIRGIVKMYGKDLDLNISDDSINVFSLSYFIYPQPEYPKCESK